MREGKSDYIKIREAFAKALKDQNKDEAVTSSIGAHPLTIRPENLEINRPKSPSPERPEKQKHPRATEINPKSKKPSTKALGKQKQFKPSQGRV